MLPTQTVLKNEKIMPMIGLGTWQMLPSKCYYSVRTALDIGYRMIDTASIYENQEAVGRAIADSSTDRASIFITSKVWRNKMETHDVIEECKKTLEEMKLEYLDQYLIHWPNKDVPIYSTLEGLKQLCEQGYIKSYGVSNFTRPHLEQALGVDDDITVNQVEFHPSLFQKDLLDFCKKQRVQLVAYSPIAQGQDLEIPVIKELAQKYDRTPSQIINNWLISKGVVTIPKSEHHQRMEENYKSLAFVLDEEDIAHIDEIGGENRLINPPFAEFDLQRV